MQRREHRRALHWASVIGVQRELAGVDAFMCACGFDEVGGEIGALVLVDLSADDLPAEDIDDEVEKEEGPRIVVFRYVMSHDQTVFGATATCAFGFALERGRLRLRWRSSPSCSSTRYIVRSDAM